MDENPLNFTKYAADAFPLQQKISLIMNEIAQMCEKATQM